MKKQIITMALLLFAMTSTWAQENQAKINSNPNVNTIVVNTTGDVTIHQGDKFDVKWGDDMVNYNMNFKLVDSVAYLSGTDDFEVTIPMLKYLEVNSVGDVIAREALAGKNISICSNGSGDVDLNLICSNIYLRNNGSGDVTLRGNANALMIETKGKGTNNAVKLKHSVSIINGYGQKDDELAVLKVLNGTVNQHTPNSEGWLYETRQFAEFMDATLSWTCQRCAAFTFERVGNEWALKGVENIPQEPENARLVRSAAPFFNQEQNRNRGIAESEDLTNVTENDTLKNTREQLDEDLGNLVKDITQGISKGSREEWSEEQWDAWADSLEMRAKEIERQAKKMEKSIETTTKSHVNVNINRPSPYEYRGLLYDANWGGFEAGLNILTPGNLPDWMGLRQMRSWCFNINIADVGIAFNRQHSMGIFTGIGIGWNNYSFNKPMFFEKDAEGYLNETPILDEQGLPLNIERSKIGVFYAQMPLMIEFKPFRQRMYIDLGVTCGMRITSWQTIQFGHNYGKYAILGEGEDAELIAADKTRDLQHKDLCINFFKVDATLRAGSVSDDIGFFVKYSLLPLFTEGKVKDADGTIVKDVLPLNIGFSINF